MKLQGILGKGTGKLGNAVFAVSGGEQIMREYNPNVSNPNTEAQVAQRAKLKLMSQLAASLKAGFAFNKMGLVSARNQFVAKNIGIAEFAENKATVDLTALQLTPSETALPDVGYSPVQGGGITLKLNSAAPAGVKRVVYVVCKSNIDDKVEIVETLIGEVAGDSRDFEVTTSSSGANQFVLAYGVEDLSSSATLKYESYTTGDGSTTAELLVNFLRSNSGYTYTMTKGATIS